MDLVGLKPNPQDPIQRRFYSDNLSAAKRSFWPKPVPDDLLCV